MFWRMLKGALFRQKSKMLLIALTTALGTSLAVAMLSVMLDVGDKINRELKAYGANINVLPRDALMLSNLYGIEGDSDQYLKESDLPKIKTIFWAFNIVDFAPFLEVTLKNDANDNILVSGTWFDRHLVLPTTEELNTGMVRLKSWWQIEGRFPQDLELTSAMAGSELARRYNLKVGDKIALTGKNSSASFDIVGIFHSGGADDERLFAPLAAVQELAMLPDRISRAEVSALTTPDNDLARRAAQNPQQLSMREMETWYCTAYVSSICYQIEEVIPEASAKPIRQVAESEGAILDKTKLLMVLITILSLMGSALGISNIVSAAVLERSREIGLLKAVGAFNYEVVLLILADILIIAALGGAAGFALGFGFAQIIGQTVFDSAIAFKTFIIPLTIFAVFAVTLTGSLPAIRYLTHLQPALVLHGGR